MADRTVRVRVIAEMPGYSAAMRAGAAETALVGEAAAVAGRGVAALGVEAGASRGGLAGLAAGSRAGGVALGQLDATAVAAGRGLRAAGVQAEASGLAMRRAGVEAEGGMLRMREGSSRAFESFKSLGALLAGGAVFFGIEKIVEKGNEYNDAMQKFQEVSRASGAQMASAGREAQALGADLKLPSATAAEAADAMVDLTKAGLSAQDAIAAARGTIQLAAAARTDVATAAQIEGDVMDQFSLKSSEAAHVADVLANTANTASGQLMDIYYAMKYVGPIAHSMGVSVKDAATAVGLLGKSGIIGETAGTALRSALVNMSKPTHMAKKGLHELGIEAFDSQGRFKGLQYVITQLGDAQKHMTSQQFIAASAMAFGKPALAAMVALAHQGGDAWNTYALQVGRAGGAAALAAAESKGLGGAMRSLGKEISAAFLQVYLGVSPVLEKVTRGFSSSVSEAIPYVVRGIKAAGDLWDIYGPTVEGKLSAAGGRIKKAAVSWLPPVEGALANLATGAIPLTVASVDSLGTVFRNAASGMGPMLSGLHDMFSSVTSGAGALAVLTGRLQVGTSALGGLSGVLGPVESAVGGIAHAFAGLPGPMQLSILAMLAMRPFRSQIQGMQSAVTGYGRSAVQSFQGVRGAMQTQTVLASQAGVSLGRWGAGFAAIEARVPVVGQMAASFRNTSSSIEAAGGRMAGFRSTAGGLATALGTGAKVGLLGAMRGLWSFLGGPWGVAIGAAMVGLDLLAKRQQEAAAAAAAHQARVSSLAQALQQANGVGDASVRSAVVQTLADAKLKDGKTSLLDTMSAAHVSALQLTNAYLGQGSSVDALQKHLLVMANANKQWIVSGKSSLQVLTPTGQAYQDAANALSGYGSELPDAIAKQKELSAAIAGGSAATVDATNPTGQLQAALKTLASSESDADAKAQALHRALALLSGGELDVQAAVANMNGSITELNGSWSAGVAKSQGYGRALLQMDGSLNTTSANGQALWNKLQDLNTQTASAAQATYDYARANGSTLPAALAQAEAAMQTSWKAAVTAGEKFGLTAAQAKELAAQMGFIPSSLAITMSTPGMTDTEKGLLYVQGLAGHLPKGATIRVSALTEDAQKAIEAAGFKVKQLPGGRQIEITVANGAAQAKLDRMIASEYALKDKTVNVQLFTTTTSTHISKFVAAPAHADGAIYHGGVRAFAQGGEDHSAQIAPGGAMRLWAEPETGGESYIPLAAAKRQRSKAILEKTARIMGGRVAWFGSGGVTGFASGGFTYTPTAAPVFGGTDDAMARYNAAVAALTAAATRQAAAATALSKARTSQTAVRLKESQAVAAAEKHLNDVRSGKHSHAQLVAAEDRLTKARQVATAADTKAAAATSAAAKAKRAADAAVTAADKGLGVAKGKTKITGFDLGAYEKQLSDSLAATRTWRTNLSVVGARGGAEVQSILEGMGQDGAALTAALAKASAKDFATITANLKAVGAEATATLADFDAQVSASARSNAQFASDLTALASRGYGTLAQQLAGQGDQAAMDLAHQAAGASDAQLTKINSDVGAQQAALSGTDLQNALLVITSLRSKPGEGISDVIASGISAQDLIALTPKILNQIQSLPDAYKQVFLRQWAGQSGATAMFSGGILPDGSATVLAGERGTGGEAYIPLGLGNRPRSTAILGDVAGRFGYQLVPAGRFTSSPGGGSPGPQEVHHHRSVVLHGAKQDSATQAADILRHMTVLS